MINKIQFTKIREVKSPNRAHNTDAGTDFFIPNYTPEFAKVLQEKNKKNKLTYQTIIGENGNEEMEITIPGGEQINIPSGIRVNIIDKHTFLEANNKSGIASNYHLVIGACVIDANYQGEMHLNMLNVGKSAVTIYTGMKIVQFIHREFIDTNWEEITNDEYNNLEKTDRGDGAFSSTGLK